MKKLKVKRLTDTAVIPTRGSKYAAGLDLYADIKADINIPGHSTVLVGTGIAIELPICTFGAIYPRSGLATKANLSLANGVGVLDEDYKGEVKVALHNHGNTTATINPGQRIAQLVVQPYTQVSIKEVNELSETLRGSGGFGSTGR